MATLFDEKKAAHVAAFFISRAGGRINILKLMKLMYLAERQSFQVYGEPMIGDSLVSMDHGPVLSTSYNCANGYSRPGSGDGWASLIDARERHDLALLRPITDPAQELLELSAADVEILDKLWSDLGGMDQWELRDYTHQHCPEWRDPHGSSHPIEFSNLLSILGYKPDQIDEMESRTSGLTRFKVALRRAA